VPSFPSLHFPDANNNAFHLSFLYYTSDVWRFTVLWTLIFYGAFHFCAASLAVFMHRKFVIGGTWILLAYGVVAGIEALISGSITGLMIGAIYKAGLFGMSTWIPFVWGPPPSPIHGHHKLLYDVRRRIIIPICIIYKATAHSHFNSLLKTLTLHNLCKTYHPN
jgi:hypothetical protein